MNNMIEILNHGTQRVQRLALTQEGDHAWEAYMGVFVVRVPGAALPSDAEFATLKAEYEAAVAKSQSNASIKAQIATLEASCTERRWREAVMSDAGKAWLSNVDSQIAALRASLQA
jgi:hypothetical protein